MRMFSNLYKVLWGEKCPGCKCFIQRAGGCKFMECPLCKYQFCWYCQDAFYTEYHYNQTDCPLRMILLYSIISVIGLAFLAKVYKSFTLVNQLGQTILSLMCSITYFILNSAKLVGFSLIKLGKDVALAWYFTWRIKKAYLLFKDQKSSAQRHKDFEARRKGRFQDRQETINAQQLMIRSQIASSQFKKFSLFTVGYCLVYAVIYRFFGLNLLISGATLTTSAVYLYMK